MSIHKRWRFNHVMVKDAPDCAGVYVLWCDRQPLAAQVERELGLAGGGEPGSRPET